MPSRLGIVLILLLGTALACNLPNLGSQPTPIVSPTSPAPSDTPALPVETPPLTPAPTEAPAATAANPDCLAPDQSVTLEVVPFDEYPQAVLEFLNAGGTLQNLDADLYAAGVANQPITAALGELTGDGVQDVIVSLYDPGSLEIPPEGMLLIYTCEAGQFALSHHQVPDEGFGAPGIRYVQDLDNDGVEELVTSSPLCGAHTCFEDAQVLGWDGKEFVNKLEGTTSDLPYPDIRIEDADGDGIFDVIAVGSGFGSVGAGPQRNIIRRWSLLRAEQGWQLLEETLGPSNYRVHILHDAEKAALDGDFDQALLLYGRVVQDTTLEEWSDPETERANLAAYALFKTAVVYLLQERPEFAESTFDQLRTTYAPGDSGYAYVEVARVFQQAYAGGGIPAGCSAARQLAEEQREQVLLPLSTETFGYANPEYAAVNICPW